MFFNNFLYNFINSMSISKTTVFPNPSSDGKRDSRLYAGGDSNISALIIKSDKFIQLRKPFPYFVKYRPEREQVREINQKVKLMNDKLFDFYSSVNEK